MHEFVLNGFSSLGESKPKPQKNCIPSAINNNKILPSNFSQFLKSSLNGMFIFLVGDLSTEFLSIVMLATFRRTFDSKKLAIFPSPVFFCAPSSSKAKNL